MSDDVGAQWHSERREAHQRAYEQLPTVGSKAYWQVVERTDPAEALPLEVLAMCVRERYLAGCRLDAERVFVALVGRVQGHVRTTAWQVASKAKMADRHEMARDIVIETQVEIWSRLVGETESFFPIGFKSALVFAEKHAADKVLIEAGEKKHHGVEKSARVPADQLDSIDQTKTNAEGQSTTIELEDPSAERAFAQVEVREDIQALLSQCSADDLILLGALYWEGGTQEEIATRLGITDRTVRNRLNRVLEFLRKRALDGEEDSGGTR